MPSFKNILIPITLALATAANATDINLVKKNGDGCPNGWGADRGPNCCYGVGISGSNSNPYCCVATDVDPFATTSVSCFASVPYSATDYSSLVSSASAALASGSSSPATNAAATTTAASAATGSMTPSGATGTAGSTPNAALPIATAQSVVIGGGVVIAAALLAL